MSILRLRHAQVLIPQMGMPPHIKCCGCCCPLNVGVIIGTSLYILFILITSFVLPATSPPSDIEHAKAFCKGTTPAYRKGDDVNSAPTPSITLHP